MTDAAPAETVRPSIQARVALWVGVINSGGLMLLGGYCLKLSVDHLVHPAVVATFALAVLSTFLAGRA